ncbi:hypothetical protein D3C81_2084710 [compost metagenome]
MDWGVTVVELRETAVVHYVTVTVLRYRNKRVRRHELVVRHVLGDRGRCSVDTELQALYVTGQDHPCGERREVVTLCNVEGNVSHGSVLRVGEQGL